MSKYESNNLEKILHTAEFAMDSILSNIRSLDTKASIILALFGVLLIPSLEILQWILIRNIFLFLKYIPLISIVIGIYFSLKSLFPQSYTGPPNVSKLMDEYSNKKTLDELMENLILYYIEYTFDNNKLAEKKLKYIKVSIFISIFSFLIILCLFLFKGVIDG